MATPKLRAWWFHRQGLDGSLRDATPAQVLERAGWARSGSPARHASRAPSRPYAESERASLYHRQRASIDVDCGTDERNRRTLSVAAVKAGPGNVTAALTARVKQGKKTKTVALGSTRQAVGKTAKVKFSVALTKTGKALVAKLKSLKASLAVTYTPTGGKAATTTVPLTFKVKPPKKKKPKK